MVVVDTTRATDRGLTVHRECDGCGHEAIGAVPERRPPHEPPAAGRTDARDARAAADPAGSSLQV